MTKREKHDPNSQAYTNALLEDIEDKFQSVLEATQPIPRLQEDMTEVLGRLDKMEPKVDTIFEEVGSLRRDVEVIREAMKLLDRHDKRFDKIEKRLSVVEQQVR